MAEVPPSTVIPREEGKGREGPGRGGKGVKASRPNAMDLLSVNLLVTVQRDTSLEINHRPAQGYETVMRHSDQLPYVAFLLICSSAYMARQQQRSATASWSHSIFSTYSLASHDSDPK
jgi:hypothetical protein